VALTFRASTVCDEFGFALPWLITSLAGDYEHAVESSNTAAAITSVLYPNDHTTCAFLVSLVLLHSDVDHGKSGKSFV
jgi:hypothetical protein